MIIGIGTDVVSIPRFTAALKRAPRLRQRVFSSSEQQLSIPSLAVRFAAREALMKAWAPARGLPLRDLAVSHGGKPVFEFGDTVQEVLQQQQNLTFHLSLSHEREMALAFVVVESYA